MFPIANGEGIRTFRDSEGRKASQPGEDPEAYAPPPGTLGYAHRSITAKTENCSLRLEVMQKQ